MNKKELAKRFNISVATLYNWEKTKPELIKLIELGLKAESGEFVQNAQEAGDKTAEQKEIEMLKGVIETLKSVIDVYVKKA